MESTPLKARSPIDVTVFETLNVSRDVQPAKASAPMEEISEAVMPLRDVQFLNAPSGI